MKKRLARLGIILFYCSINLWGQPPLQERHLNRVAEAYQLVEHFGESVWPGFRAPDAPTIVIEGEFEYLLNRSEALPGFETRTRQQFAGHPIWIRDRVLPPNLLASFPIGGQPAVVVGTAETVDRSPAYWILTVAHELFHVFQENQGLTRQIEALQIGTPEDPNWHLNFPFPYQEKPIENALHLAGYSLFRLSQLESETSRADVRYEARVALEALDNLRVLLELTTGGDQRHFNYLRYQTGKEGTARYVEYRLARAVAANPDYHPVSDALPEDAESYRKVWQEKYEKDLIYQIRHTGHVSRNRVEFYSLGLGLALALDRVSPGWKQGFGSDGSWLDDRLRAVFNED